MTSIKDTTTMYVIHRNGIKEEVSFDRVRDHIKKLCKYPYQLNDIVNSIEIAKNVVGSIVDGITTEHLNKYAAELSASKSTIHPDYGTLAARLEIANFHKNTKDSFSDTMEALYLFVDNKTNQQVSLIDDEVYKIIQENKTLINNAINYIRDYNFDYFGFKTLEKGYLLKINGKIVERPQHMFMRVALGIHRDDINAAFETYNLLSEGYIMHATPTLFNSGLKNGSYASCYLLEMQDDSIEGIFDTLKMCAMISKNAGGIGLHAHKIRGKGSPIAGTNGTSNGLIPFLKIFNETARTVDQCFDSNTIVYTINGSKKIIKIVPNDLVLTNDGTFQRVLQVRHTMQENNMLRITINDGTTVNVTHLHPLYSVKDKHSKPEYVEAHDLQVGNYIGTPIPTYENDISYYTEDDCYMYMLMLVRGTNCIDLFSIECPNQSDKEFVKKYFNENLIKYTEYEDTFTWQLQQNWKFTSEMLYKINSVMLHLSKAKLTKMYSVLLTKQFMNDNEYELKYIELRLGIIDEETEFIENGILYSMITDIHEVKYKGIVVDFDIENNHNYATSIGLAHNGGGKRKGSFAIYLEPWHSDIFEFLELKMPIGSQELRALDLFYALWIPDLFMKRVESNGDWTLFSPNEAKGLEDTYGDAFEELYTKYEQEGKGRKTIKAKELYDKIIETQIMTGTPYMLYKDAANSKSNQKNLGVIKSSNLCSEIMEYTSTEEVAVCNLCTVAVSALVKDGKFDYQELYNIVKKITINLNKVIDVTYYPIKESKLSNLRHRPIGIGIQGLADVFLQMGYSFASNEAKQINKNIFETMSYAFLVASMELAKERGEMIKEWNVEQDMKKKVLMHNKLWKTKLYSVEDDEEITNKLMLIKEKELARMNAGETQIGAYYTFEGSPLSQGQFQHNLWEQVHGDKTELSGMWDWDTLRENIIRYGVRNSLGLSCQPTASSAQILGNNECIEPYTTNLYTRVVLSGQFQVVNKHLIYDLDKIGLWNSKTRSALIKYRGSVQDIDGIPAHIKERYKTVWEISNKDIIDMSADRGRFICQSQSMNLFMAEPIIAKIRSMHLYSWKKGLKTGIYYLRSQPAATAQQFTVEVKNEDLTAQELCSLNNREACLMCQ